MSSLYSWHDEHMVRLEMQDLHSEIEQIRLLQDAGQGRTGWLKQQIAKVHTWMTARGLPLHPRISTPVPQYYQSTSFKFSP